MVWRFDGRIAFVPEQRSKSWSVPQIFVVETEPRHEADNRLPLYAQVEHVIIGRISDGLLPAGTRLPSGDSLVREYAVSRATIRAVMQSLVQRRWAPFPNQTYPNRPEI
jgi:hypothetical protein